MEKEKKDSSFMVKLATLIVDKRKGFYLIFIMLIIFSILSMDKVKVNNDLTTYLPEVPRKKPSRPGSRKTGRLWHPLKW